MAEPTSGPRDWAVWFQPRALEGRPEGVIFAGLCIFSLALIALADLNLGPGVRTVGSFQVIPVIAAGWLLSDRSLAAVSVAAILFRVAVVAAGANDVVTASVQAGVVPFMAIVSRTAAVAVAAAQASAARDRLVLRIARIASSAKNLDQVLDQVVQELAREGLRGGTIALIDERDRLYIAAAAGELDQSVRDLRLPVGEGIMGRAAAEGRSILVADLDADGVSSPTRKVGSNAQIRSLVVVPMLAAGRVIGVLEVDSSQPHHFTDSDVLLLEQVAVATAGAVQQAGALRLADDSLQRRVRELSILLEAARGLAASLDLAVLARAVCRSVAEITAGSNETPRRSSLIRLSPPEGVVVGEYDEAGDSLAGFSFGIGDNPSLVEVMRTGELVTVGADRLVGSLGRRLTKSGVRLEAFAPVRVGNQLWGVLSVGVRDEHLFDAAELRLMQGMADLAGLAVGNAESLRAEKGRSEQLREHAD
ncbi:MAG: GAF domain-containing protein, partial [Chloroflexota bacterium]